MQKYSSAKTSINSKKVPALFTKVNKYFGWKKGTRNLDYGGGKWNTATNFLKSKGVRNLIYDKYNRSDTHNNQIMEAINLDRVDTATLSNTLNVIKERSEKETILYIVKAALKKEGICYITCYNSGKTGESNPDSWQEGKSLKSYLPLVKKIFGNGEIKHGMIIAKKN